MTANLADEALERLNYFNGQRLAATDFRAEQSYLVGMRRVLNRSLYTDGIVAGLEVERDKGNSHRVIVRRGLAFDHLGREIVVPEDVEVLAMGTPSTTPGVVFGNLLVASYREQRRHPAADACAVAAPCTTTCSGDLAWGAPTRIAQDAVFEVLDSWPAADSGRIVLAQLELTPTCEVRKVMLGVRKYAVSVKSGKTRAMSIVGEHDIAPGNPKVLRFHVADGLPDRAVLYLKGGEFSPLWYSELPSHTHKVNVKVKDNNLPIDFNHSHAMEGQVAKDGAHVHSYWHQAATGGGGVLQGPADPSTWPNNVVAENDPHNFLRESGAHTHDLSQIKIGAPIPASITLTPDFATSSVDPTGLGPGARGAPAYRYFQEMEVKLDTVPVTQEMLQQTALVQLGIGASQNPEQDPFVAQGTPAIDLTMVNLALGPGEHTLEFIVPAGKGGGKLYYNLYID